MKTTFTPTFFEKNWHLTNVKLKPITKPGMVGQVGIVIAKEGKYTYKTSGYWKTSKNLDRDLKAYEFLNKKSFPYISQILKTRKEKRFTSYNGKLVYLIKHIEGKHPGFTPKTYSELGKIVAKLHAVKDFPFESDYKPAKVIPQLIENAKKYPFKDEYISILQSIPKFTHLPITAIHTEITPGNVIQTPEGKIMVIDWDEVGSGPRVLDLGVSLINHFVTEDLKILEKNAKAYYKSYFSIVKMKDSEKRYIYDTALFWACCWISYGNLNKRWKRIKWAIENKERLVSLYS